MSPPKKSAKRSARPTGASADRTTVDGQRTRARRGEAATAGRRAPLEVIRGARAAGTPAKAFGQRPGASNRQLLVFNMVRARARVQAAVQGMVPGSAERPIGEGKWNTREIVLHLHFWDRETLRSLESAHHGIRPSWADYDREDFSRANAAGLDELRHLGWDEATRALHSGRQALIEAIERIPELPADVWDTTHALGELLNNMPYHDLHHADAIKRWRARAGA